MPIQADIDHPKRLITETYTGAIRLEDILASKKEQLEGDPLVGYSLIVDMSHARLLMELDDLQQLVDYFRAFKPYIQNTRVALVSGTASETAISYMYRELVNSGNLGFEVNVFTTLKAAQSWVG